VIVCELNLEFRKLRISLFANDVTLVGLQEGSEVFILLLRYSEVIIERIKSALSAALPEGRVVHLDVLEINLPSRAVRYWVPVYRFIWTQFLCFIISAECYLRGETSFAEDETKHFLFNETSIVKS
jgi:hypothetical protein